MTITKEELDLINGLTREQLIYVLIDYQSELNRKLRTLAVKQLKRSIQQVKK